MLEVTADVFSGRRDPEWIVRGRAGHAAGYRRDDARALERWLVQTGKGRIDDPLYEYVASEVGR